ncbi:hypothetical protein SAMN05444746_108268 [Variovorax sp. OK212]|nr:hypothetical protein SAMN05518853_108268 [Variovorax sp. OK202]SFD60757.1 hypothetical protein SAMN05444746_108268 [Variovorax sp. OK212]
MEATLASGIGYAIFFYKRKIHPLKEYELRKNENIRFAGQFGVPFIDADCDRDNWFERARGMAHEPERGVRAAARYPGLMQSECNWRKGGGSARMTEISKRESFHQQAYCGCVYSLRDANRHRVEGGRERMQLGVKFYGDEEPATD